MTKIPPRLLNYISLIVHVLAVPAFFLSFVMLYRPTRVVAFLSQQLGDSRLAFNTTMLMCIILIVMAASRGVMYAWKKRLEIRWGQYIIWCMIEVVISSLFCALYMTLMYLGQYPFFSVEGITLAMLIAISVYPYLLLAMLSIILSPAEAYASEDSLIRFHDNTQKLKFIIASTALLYIEADENYIKIIYTEGEQVKTYSLRSSMKAIETLMAKHGLVRCQRSYYINPMHIKALRRDKDGTLYADLNVSNTKAIPVSAMYQKELSDRL